MTRGGAEDADDADPGARPTPAERERGEDQDEPAVVGPVDTAEPDRALTRPREEDADGRGGEGDPRDEACSFLRQ
jgi:hypothetical protein